MLPAPSGRSGRTAEAYPGEHGLPRVFHLPTRKLMDEAMLHEHLLFWIGVNLCL